MDIKKLSILEVNLSARAMHGLQKTGVKTVGDMLRYDADSLLAISNLGQKSVDEILKACEYYRDLDRFSTPAAIGSGEFSAWAETEDGRDAIHGYLDSNDLRIDALEALSPLSYNLLLFNGYTMLKQFDFNDVTALMRIPRMDSRSAMEIHRAFQLYIYAHKNDIMSFYVEKHLPSSPSLSISDLLHQPESRDGILRFVASNNLTIDQLDLSNRPRNRLLTQGYTHLSDIIFMSKEDFMAIPSMGAHSAEEIARKIQAYLIDNEQRILAVLNGNLSALWDDSLIQEKILGLYQDAGFRGLSFQDFQDKLDLPEIIDNQRLKRIIGSLIAENKLEYVDFRCYRVYGKFETYLELCPHVDARSRACITKRLHGATLESIATEYNLTRERVRQIVNKYAAKVRSWYISSTGMNFFDEDYFSYFYATYDFDKKDCSQWLGMPDYIFNYLDLTGIKRGKEDLSHALEDVRNLDAGLRLKIKNYLNRNKIFIDGRWVDKRRADLEEVVVRKFCQDDVSFAEFTRLYNQFLEDEGVPYDDAIYYTDSVKGTRRNILSDAHFLLWKQNEQIRYYDVDGRDYAELLDALNFDSYENIEYSTAKLFTGNPEIMQKYDIRNHYELHNLLRKTVPEGSFHGFHCGKMPMIKFGTFDRDATIFNILREVSPINVHDLCDLLHAEFGYDPAVVQGTYLKPFLAYYHKGIYSIEQKVMLEERRNALKAMLTDEFYYIDEIRQIYKALYPNADTDEINPYNLKQMGFLVLTRYAIQNHATLEAFCEDILTREDLTDITAYRKRLAYVQMFSQKLMELKRNLEVVEFERNQLIHIRKLSASGITKEIIREYCDAVYDFVGDNTYFSIQSLRKDGFQSDIYQFGFSDFFYANLLVSDNRFSFSSMFGNYVFYKGTESVTIKTFEMDIIQRVESIDALDMMTLLNNYYGCSVKDKWDIIYKIANTEIYYDKILDRIYANIDLYFQELDDMEGV